MTQYKIIMGDWSDDGHGKTSNYLVDIVSDHTVEQLQDNYKANCEKWGHSLKNVCDDYEDWSLPEDLVEKMLADGATSVTPGTSYLDYDYQLDFVMEFMGIGLDSFKWIEVKEDAVPILVGGYGAKIESSFGYGLFS